MAGGFAALDTGFPDLSGYEGDARKLQALEDYLVQLLENLRYVLHNLGAENFSEQSMGELAEVISAPIRAELSDPETGLAARIEANAAAIRTEVSRASGEEESLATRITQTADALTAEATRASAAEGSLSTRVTQTADALTAEAARANAAEGNLSTRITANAEGLTSKVEKNGVISAINQSAETVTIRAGKIDLSGCVTAADLSGSGTTTINGDNITTGTIDAAAVAVTNLDADNITSGTLAADYISGGSLDADGIDLYDSFDVYAPNERGIYKKFGCIGGGTGRDGQGNTTYGVAVQSKDRSNYLIVTGGGVRMTAGACSVYVTSTGAYIDGGGGVVDLFDLARRVSALEGN